MDDYALILRLDLSDSSPEGPGWYVYATGSNAGNQELVRKPQRISGHHAVTLAVQMQQAMPATQDGQKSPSQIVMEGNQKVVQRINDQIAYAEAQARRVGQLRRILQTESQSQGE